MNHLVIKVVCWVWAIKKWISWAACYVGWIHLFRVSRNGTLSITLGLTVDIFYCLHSWIGNTLGICISTKAHLRKIASTLFIRPVIALRWCGCWFSTRWCKAISKLKNGVCVCRNKFWKLECLLLRNRENLLELRFLCVSAAVGLLLFFCTSVIMLTV
jgi:hypothetical protein